MLHNYSGVKIFPNVYNIIVYYDWGAAPVNLTIFKQFHWFLAFIWDFFNPWEHCIFPEKPVYSLKVVYFLKSFCRMHLMTS